MTATAKPRFHPLSSSDALVVLRELALGALRAPRRRWYADAACSGDERYSETDSRYVDLVDELREGCLECPVLADCLLDAVTIEKRPGESTTGIRGGLTSAERESLASIDKELAAGAGRRSRRGNGRQRVEFLATIESLVAAGASVVEAMSATGAGDLDAFRNRLWRAQRSDLFQALRANDPAA